ncbi:uncharacterized protein LOC127497814 [Ctenopharyngodon idella]|uniref:uncharacterized protein LOC127497814 n=1 Tax=Ctenopharyngodon idella TaxID=7959 RepID=UPI0022317988|nr:uncharacterized protein LOC127497814 [Ctenopharyngodon idella]XP_051722522.1 uncharacterized protein LOC127497814 [Ctenopharyngodon idella]XP_051722523.1 uncharacterized protein LOC127497814 [Ctenopharyngodon idella]XP_051722524.1 uncharacterized protein LOC127497814 [Ctenopharyngodon idella]XP_051722525.1 uncharacterized protein LOC127497814 [Ctenopharyngodon idella]
MNSAISKSTQSLTTAEDMRNQTKLIMQPYANWEEYLTPAPLSIAILGELVFISSSTDFSINKNPPKNGYKFIKYPDSFRACLMQVCNSGWWAFNEAHKSMDQIRLHTAQVPDYMKTAVKILFQADDEVVKAHLPDQLKNIQDIADECLQLSDATEKRFTNVINIIQELLEACVNAEHFYGEELESVKKKLEESKLREQSALETKKRTEKAVSAMEKELGEAHESYKKALDSLPGGWEMIGMDFVGGITQSISGLVNGLVSAIIEPVKLMCSATTNVSHTIKNIKDQESTRDVVAEINVYSKSAEILSCAQNIQLQMEVNSEDDDIAWTNLYDQKNKNTKTDFVAKQLERINEDFQKISDCPAKIQAQNLCKQGMEICNQLAKYAPDGNCDKEKSTKIIHEVLVLVKSAHVFDSKSKDITNSPAISPKPPMMQNELNKSENMSPSQRATENARFAIEQTRAQVNKTRETYEKCMENLEKNQKELTDILVTMRNCELKEIDFKTTIEMLVKGMDAMGRVKEQWEKMVHFFQMVSNIVKTSLSKTLTNFVSTSEKTQKLSYNAKLFSKDLLYTQAFQASNIASLVHMISGTYTDVSSKYLMDRVSSLGKLMAMDKSTPEFEHERQALQNSCDEAQKGIVRLVLKNKEEFDRKSTARLETIEHELLAILPPAPPEEIKSIQEVVQAGFSDEEKVYY